MISDGIANVLSPSGWRGAVRLRNPASEGMLVLFRHELETLRVKNGG